MKTNEKNRIGENIRNLRREREVKQITLALELQIGRQSV